MNIRKNILVAALTLAAAGAASADSLSITYQSTSGVTETTNLTSGYLTGAMQFMTSGGTSFEAYCVEIMQSRPTLNSGAQTYTTGSFSSTQSSLLQGLYSSSYAGLVSAQDKAAFQTAIWEITQDAPGVTNAGKNSNLQGYGLLDVNPASASKGTFYFGTLGTLTNQASAVQNTAFMNQVAGYLAAASSYDGQAQYQLTLLKNDNFQDLLTVTPVPEPESYALMLAGLGVVAFVARRRKAG